MKVVHGDNFGGDPVFTLYFCMYSCMEYGEVIVKVMTHVHELCTRYSMND